MVATGIHRGDTPEEMADTLGADIVANYRVVNHDCDDASNLVYVGTLVHGTEFYVNKLVYEAEMVITTGVLGPHYFAGFSGGRKSIFPGVSGRVSIEHNHSLMTHPNAGVAALEGNPVSERWWTPAGRWMGFYRECGYRRIRQGVRRSGGRYGEGLAAWEWSCAARSPSRPSTDCMTWPSPAPAATRRTSTSTRRRRASTTRLAPCAPAAP